MVVVVVVVVTVPDDGGCNGSLSDLNRFRALLKCAQEACYYRGTHKHVMQQKGLLYCIK